MAAPETVLQLHRTRHSSGHNQRHSGVSPSVSTAKGRFTSWGTSHACHLWPLSELETAGLTSLLSELERERQATCQRDGSRSVGFFYVHTDRACNSRISHVMLHCMPNSCHEGASTGSHRMMPMVLLPCTDKDCMTG